jgi:hypothetical protein
MQKGTKAASAAALPGSPVLSKRQILNMAADGGQTRPSPQSLSAGAGRFDAVSLASIGLYSEVEFVAEITRLWAEAGDRFLSIGRALVSAYDKLGRDRYFAMVNGNDFPFTRSIAYRLKAVAEAVDRGRLAPDRMPRDYSIAYMLVTLTDEELRKADEIHLLRADVKRREIEEFRRSLRQNLVQRRSELRKRRDSLLARIRQMQDELRQIEDELGGDVIDGNAVQVEGGLAEV